MDFARSVLQPSGSVFVWGDERTPVTVTAFAILRASALPFLWLDVGPPSGPPDDYESLLGPKVTPDRRFVTHLREELRPESVRARPTDWTTARAVRRGSILDDLTDFLRLPRTVQVLAARLITLGRRSSLFVTNVDRFDEFYPEDPVSTARYARAVSRRGIKLIVSYCGGVRRDRLVFDHVFRLDPGLSGDWRSSLVVGEQGGLDEGSAGVVPTPLGSIASVRDLLTPDPGGRPPVRIPLVPP